MPKVYFYQHHSNAPLFGLEKLAFWYVKEHMEYK